jgi:hypothetical protein
MKRNKLRKRKGRSSSKMSRSFLWNKSGPKDKKLHETEGGEGEEREKAFVDTKTKECN